MKLREERELQGRFSRGKLLSAFVVAGALLAPAAAQAAPPVSVFNDNVPPVPCTVQADGITFCTDSPRSTVDSPVDGAPIDVNVGLPDESEFGSGPYPLMMLFHGYAGVKIGTRADATLARARLRHLLDDQPRLSRVVRVTGFEGCRPGRLRERIRAPDRQSLRPARRPGVRGHARR